MPELPEVETICRSLEPLVVDRTIVAVAVWRRDLRFRLAADFELSLARRRIKAIERRAKYLLLRLDDGRAWIVHLGMSGRFLRVPSVDANERGAHQHVTVTLDDGAGLAFTDPRRFGFMVVGDPESCLLLSGLGPEPLDTARFDADYLGDQRRKTRRTVKETLMDQRIVAGLGNIYVNEILYVAGIRPGRRMHRLSRADCKALIAATRTIVSEAIEHRGTSISDFLDGVGKPGAYQSRRRVYDRAGEPCVGCASVIRMRVIGQRSSFYCPSCQV